MQLTVGSYVFDADCWGPDGGVPVLLLHGFPEGARCWDSVGPLLAAAGVRAVAPDQRGYSRGARPREVVDYEVDRLADDAEGFLDALGWPTAHVVGHDWGAVVAWVLTGRRPERVRSLTAVSVPHPAVYGAALAADPTQQRMSAYIGLFRIQDRAERVLLDDDAARLRAMFAGSGLDADAVARLVAPLREPGALTAALSWYRAMRADHYASTLPSTVPTTFVWGTHDIAIARSTAEAGGRLVEADYRFVPLEGVSHWVPEQAPAELAAIVLQRIGVDPG